MIDLHIHSDHSDGVCSVAEILCIAQKSNLSIISITDHNTIEAYKQIQKIKPEDLFTGKTILGVEINCVFKDYRIELLAYDFKNFGFIENWLESNYSKEKEFEFRTNEYEKLKKIMQDNGIENKCPKYYKEKGTLPHTIIYDEIKKDERNKSY